MKHTKWLITVVVLLQTVLFTLAQPPDKMSYQAVIRNSSNQLLANQTVGIRISILQGTADGTEVYTETQTPTTNTNSLVSIEIGGGSGFNTINWANGPYFIKTDTDPAGGTNYTITGTSQILSVPYALHANTAANISNFNALQLNGIGLPYTFGPDTNYVGTEGSFIGFGHDGVSEDFIGYKNNTFYFKDSPEGGDIADPNVVVGGKLGVGIEILDDKLEVDGDIDVHNNTVKNLADPVNAQDAATKAYVDSKEVFYLGKDTLGGIVYYIYKGHDGLQHGLVVSKDETQAKWQNTGVMINANRTDDGAYNTNLMTDSPAKDWITNNFSSEWYLPSIDELSILWRNRFHVTKALRTGGYTLLSDNAYYWSSLEHYQDFAYLIDFQSGTASTDGSDQLKILSRYVRAVRAF